MLKDLWFVLRFWNADQPFPIVPVSFAEQQRPSSSYCCPRWACGFASQLLPTQQREAGFSCCCSAVRLELCWEVGNHASFGHVCTLWKLQVKCRAYIGKECALHHESKIRKAVVLRWWSAQWLQQQQQCHSAAQGLIVYCPTGKGQQSHGFAEISRYDQ